MGGLSVEQGGESRDAIILEMTAGCQAASQNRGQILPFCWWANGIGVAKGKT
jgi:hypothetical protein